VSDVGTAHVYADATLRHRISTDPALKDLIGIIEERVFEPPDIWLLRIRSPLLPSGYNHFRELVAEGRVVKFKPYADV
jgi:hypothetical protein